MPMPMPMPPPFIREPPADLLPVANFPRWEDRRTILPAPPPPAAAGASSCTGPGPPPPAPENRPRSCMSPLKRTGRVRSPGVVRQGREGFSGLVTVLVDRGQRGLARLLAGLLDLLRDGLVLDELEVKACGSLHEEYKTDTIRSIRWTARGADVQNLAACNTCWNTHRAVQDQSAHDCRDFPAFKTQEVASACCDWKGCLSPSERTHRFAAYWSGDSWLSSSAFTSALCRRRSSKMLIARSVCERESEWGESRLADS